VSRRRSGVG